MAISKTPKFDEKLEAILSELAPHERTCKWADKNPHCEKDFNIEQEDIEFLKALRVPAPNFCPTCRRMRRFLHMNHFQFFKRNCKAPLHEEQMISIFPEECPFPVYDYKFYISDEFDPFSFGVRYENGKSPLETLFSLRKVFPMPSFLNRDPSSINSDYSNGGRDTKNGYYVFGCYGSENVWYCLMAGSSKDVMDSCYMLKGDHVYNGFHSETIYKSSYVYFSKDCSDCNFIYDCKNCTDCFGCVNLRNARYCVFNKQLTKEKYDAFIAYTTPLSRESLAENESKFWNLVKSNPINASKNVRAENVSGVMVLNSRNAYNVTDSHNSEHIRYADGALDHKDSMDLLFSGGNSSLLYGTTNIGSQSSNVKFSVSCKFSTNSEFIFNCKNVDNCFMCFGLQDKNHCILNVQYEPEEYFILLDEIKSEMLKREEYGDGVGMEFSAQAYNFSTGQTSFPLSDEDIVKLGGFVAKEPETNAGSVKIISVDEVPQTIDEVADDIVNFAIQCEVTGRPFRIISSELQFYRKMKLPLPTIHPVIRMKNRIIMTPIGIKHKAICAKCSNDIYSLFDPREGYVLYCESCFQNEVN